MATDDARPRPGAGDRMGRHKTISDADVLAAARRVFQDKGHGASTRDIAAVAGVSEAVLYQRFKNKDALFFAAMLPCAPDVAAVLGPPDPPADARQYLLRVVARLADYFLECVPAGMRVMMHPAFDAGVLAESEAMSGTGRLTTELIARLRRLQGRRLISTPSLPSAAKLITAVAHDWALQHALSGGATPADRHELMTRAEIVWRGLAPVRARGGGRVAPAARRAGSR